MQNVKPAMVLFWAQGPVWLRRLHTHEASPRREEAIFKSKGLLLSTSFKNLEVEL